MDLKKKLKESEYLAGAIVASLEEKDIEKSVILAALGIALSDFHKKVGGSRKDLNELLNMIKNLNEFPRDNEN